MLIADAPGSFLEAGPAMLVATTAGAVAAFVLITWLVWKRDVRVYLGLVLALAVIQIFWPAGYISVALLTAAFGLPGLLLRTRREYWGAWSMALLALALSQAVALLWSSKVGAVALAVLSTAALWAVYLAVRLAMDRFGNLDLSLYLASPFLIVEAILVVVFRVYPTPARWAYLSSPWGALFSEPEVLLLKSGHQENILDVGKSGGTFLNANIASLFLAAAALVMLWAAVRGRNWYFAVVGVLLVVAMAFTGSKSPMLIAVLVVLSAVSVSFAAQRRWKTLLGLLGGAASVALLIAIVKPQVYGALFGTMDDRWRLWGLSLTALQPNPLTGLGYGNWEHFIAGHWTATFGTERPEQRLPPHNFVLAAWTDGGVMVAALSLFLAMIVVFWAARNLYRDARGAKAGWLQSALVFAAVLWVPLHGITDTTSFFGENHVLAFYAAMVGIVASHARFAVSRLGQD